MNDERKFLKERKQNIYVVEQSQPGKTKQAREYWIEWNREIAKEPT